MTFTPGQTEQTITVMVSAAPRYDVSRTFTVYLSDPMGVTISTGQATGTIENPNAPPQVAISDATVDADPSMPTAAIFTVTLSTPSDQPVTLSYATADGSAFAGFDYVAIPSRLLTFTPGQTSQTVTVTVNPEPADAVQKFFTIKLSNPANALIQTGQATVTIVHPSFGTDNMSGDAARDFEIAALVSISAQPVTASTSGATTAVVTVTIAMPSSQTVFVDYTTADGTARAGSDYVAVPSGSLSLAPGQTDQTVAVTVNPEPGDALSRSFTVNLIPPTNAIILGAQATVTINDPSGGSTTPTPTPPLTPTPTPTPDADADSDTRLQPRHLRPRRHRLQPLHPRPAPTFMVAMRTTSGKGKKKMYRDQLFFSAPLDSASAGNTAHYHVTQKITKKKTVNVAVLTATYSAANNSVTLVLRKPAPGKALQVMVSGLVGANGAPLGTFATEL